MKAIQNILFPVDFSPSCVAMAPFVKRAVELFSAQLTILHVVGSPASGFELYARPLPEIEEDRRNVARKSLYSFLEGEFPHPRVPRLLCTGDAATRISEIARERKFDMIVMPTHAGGFRRTLLGSTTAKVLNDADCPVLTTRHAETIEIRALEHREWACAVGLGTDSERVLRFAAWAAGAAHANLSIIHAIQAANRASPIQFDLEERVESAGRREAHRHIDELQAAVGSRAPIHIACGPIKEALLQLVGRLRADVLIIGRSPGVAERLRDLTYAVVRDAPCPVLSV